MDHCEKRNNKRQSGKRFPRIPIKTYKWEDVRRSRRKGGYPWTHLYKEAFNDNTDPKDFTMDGLRKGKTSSASSASDSLEIKEITEDDVKGLKDIDSSYVVIEGPILLGGQLEETTKEQEGIIESADSSDNISQYLDKEERGPEQQMESTETLTLAGSSTPQIQIEDRSLERAKSEEPKRKRKLSIESNYSRLSLSKLGFMKRLREAKGKIKLPKLGGSTKHEKKENPIAAQPNPKFVKGWEPKPPKSEKPVYIHIPLKPPEGETDEFSYLEFGEKKTENPPPEVQIEVSEDIQEENVQEEAPNDFERSENVETSSNNLGLTIPNDQEDDVSAIIFLEGDEEDENKGDYDIMVVDIDESSQEMTMSQVTNTEVRRQVLESIKRVESQAELGGGNLSRSSSRASKSSRSSVRKRRAKSAEPEKKRKSSIDSSYSRKSLSKIGFLKKLKEIQLPFRKSQSKKSISETNSSKKEDIPITAPTTSKKITTVKDEKPVYIHIPLKPPPGETDEYSHLEFETAPPPVSKEGATETNEEEKSPIETPDTSKTPQFIFLTPPSDDEILDRPDIPETPSSETGSLFHFGELKQIAMKAVDQVEGVLDAVVEESDSADGSRNASEPPVREDIKNEDKNITIDEEDGLKSTQKLTEDSKPALKSNLKNEASPLPKKKVSFKRRKSSQVSKDDGYEDIQTPSEQSEVQISAEKDESSMTDTSALSTTISMSTNEEKMYLDSEKPINSASLQEDYNKWSKMSDHEYEPVNPPPDNKSNTSPPKSHVSEVLNPSSSFALHQSDDETQPDMSVQEMQMDIENRFLSNPPATKNVQKATSPSRKSPSKRSSRSHSKEKEPDKPGKIQTALREGATKFKTKLQGIKKPTISLPSRPKFQRPNIKKPNINLPKLPDFSATFRRSSKPEDKKVDVETKSVDGPEQKTQGVFNFSTYPRLFKKKKKDFDSGSLSGKKESQQRTEEDISKFFKREGTTSSRTDSIRIPLHSEESMDQDNGLFPRIDQEEFEEKVEDSPRQYQDDTDADEDEIRQQERQEKHRAAVAAVEAPEQSRWDHGTYFEQHNGTHHEDEEEALEIIEALEKEDRQMETITDLDQPEEITQPLVPTRQRGHLQQHDSIDTTHSRDVGSSISSLGHRRGVLEEIDSDQFFLREKGISQDNIDMGRYLSTEIREAFRSPTNALADMSNYNYEELRASNQSLPETKKKQMKKPKRKKTPHASQERLRYEQESENEDYNFMPPIRPRRRSKRKKKQLPSSAIIPHTETISIHQADPEYRVEQEIEFPPYYENNRMEDKDTPDINVSQPYKDVLRVHETMHRRASEPIPAAPPRKHKSLKSLNASEHESIFDDYERDAENNNIDRYNKEPPFIEHQEESHFDRDFESKTLPPKPPTRSRSKTRSMSRATSHGDSILDRTDSIMYEEDREPVIEEPFVKDLRDAMGYAIVDKNQNKNWEHKFCTLPRSQNNSSAPPERPLRNYSTLGPSRPPRKLSRNMTDEEKENIDITQYIEIEDERDLQSGEMIQKIQNRPLPAPPRPPRAKSRPLSDITSHSNVEIHEIQNTGEDLTGEIETAQQLDEAEVSTQTEPLPADFVCEEVQQEDTDKIMTPSAMRKNGGAQSSETQTEDVKIKTVLITPTKYTYQEETITHGQLLVEPLNGAKILPDSELSRERIIPITSDEEETSEIPESFTQLSAPQTEDIQSLNQPQKPPRIQPARRAESVEVLKTQKLQVSDLDVDRLSVNELVANKIVVSEIDSGNIISHEINSKSGTLRLGDLELDPSVIKKLLEQLQECTKQASILEDASASQCDEEEKKNSIEPHKLELSKSVESNNIKEPTNEEIPQITQTPQHETIQKELVITEKDESDVLETPGIVCEHLMEKDSELESPISSDEQLEPPIRPPRNIEKKFNGCELDPSDSAQIELEVGHIEGSTEENYEVRLVEGSEIFRSQVMIEPEVDDEPPPRPPQPQVPYIPSQPPASFYALRAQHYVDGTPEDIPHIPRRKRHHRPQTMSRSSSSESNGVPAPRRRVRSPEPSIPQLAGQLAGACSVAARNSMKNLIDQVNIHIASTSNEDPETRRQNIQVVIVILLVLIAGLLLLGYGDGRTVHLHHWEYFNPPTDI